MKKIIYIATIGITLLTTSCDDFLDRQVPQGIVTGDQIASPEYVDNLVISAYAIWATGDDINSSFSLWNYDVRSDDCYKGGSGTEDGGVFNALEISKGINTTDWNINDIWKRLYQCITRANTALQSLDQMDEKTYPLKNQRIAEMRFLRGHAHFMLKELFKKIVIVNDENMDPDAYNELSNTTYTNNEQWQKIADDFQFAYDNLLEVQIEKGRPTQAAAAAYLAKTYLYKAYRQDGANNNLTGINEEDLKQVVKYTDPLIMAKAGYGLENDYSMNFLPQYENGAESVWAIQYSINDGTSSGGNTNNGAELNAPSWEPYFPCCDFHKMSFNMANAFRTGTDGLPLFDTFNDAEMKGRFKEYFDENSFDPRLSHTAAIPGYPYKYNPDLLYEEKASRSPGDYGYLKSVKELVPAGCDCIIVNRNSMNVKQIRYAEVLLWKAEILIQLDRHKEARPIINKLRERANNSRIRLLMADGTPYMNYKVSLYTDEAAWTKDYAWKALMFENRLETACEGRRFFDLQRWGILEPTMNAYFKKEKTRFSWMNNAVFVAGRDEYKPIPQQQMNWAKGNYIQNPGY